MKRTPVSSSKAPAAIGPYSQGIGAGEFVFVSGQTPLRADGTLVDGTTAEQTEQCLRNVREVLLAAGLDMDRVVKTTVYMTELRRFPEMNAVYARHFSAPFPARATVEVSALPKGASVEIDAIATRA